MTLIANDQIDWRLTTGKLFAESLVADSLADPFLLT